MLLSYKLDIVNLCQIRIFHDPAGLPRDFHEALRGNKLQLVTMLQCPLLSL